MAERLVAEFKPFTAKKTLRIRPSATPYSRELHPPTACPARATSRPTLDHDPATQPRLRNSSNASAQCPCCGRVNEKRTACDTVRLGGSSPKPKWWRLCQDEAGVEMNAVRGQGPSACAASSELGHVRELQRRRVRAAQRSELPSSQFQCGSKSSKQSANGFSIRCGPRARLLTCVAARCRLTLPSSGRLPAGFAVCKPPLMSNVRRSCLLPMNARLSCSRTVEQRASVVVGCTVEHRASAVGAWRRSACARRNGCSGAVRSALRFPKQR